MIAIRLAGAMSVVCLALFFQMRPSHSETDVFTASLDGSGQIPPLGNVFLTLQVPPGRYAIFAKLGLDHDDTKTLVTVDCVLQAGGTVSVHGGVDPEDPGASDRNIIRLAPSGFYQLDNAVIPFQVVYEFPPSGNSNINLKCDARDANGMGGNHIKMSFREAKITAIRVDGTVCKKPGPIASCSGR